jgi:hypothetical protein
LEEYCRSNPVIKEKIRSILRETGKGVEYLLDSGVSISIINDIVKEFVPAVGQSSTCVGCNRGSGQAGSRVCDSCNQIYS